MGLWFYNEYRLAKEFSLRSQLGVDFGVSGFSEFEAKGTGDFIATLNLTFEPRWYYNLEKRVQKDKDISKNSGNFFALMLTSHFDDTSWKDDDRLRVYDQIRIIPKWGIRRHIGEHFNYELGFGYGYEFYLSDNIGEQDNGEASVDFHIRIGYTF